MSRRAGEGRVVADLQTGEGLAEAVAGVDAVAHLASSPSAHTEQTDVHGTRRLVEHLPNDVHLIYISIVGVDKTWAPYYQAKLAAEFEVEKHPRHTILRTTQWHPLLDYFFAKLPGLPLLFIPRIPVQPMSVPIVAQHFADAVVDEPRGRLRDLGGPEVVLAPELLRRWFAKRGLTRWVIGFPFLGAIAGGCLTTHNNLPGPTWDDWLEDH